MSPGDAPEAAGPAPPRPPVRTRRRRALASALRLVAAQEPPPAAPALLRERLSAIAASQGVFLPPEAGSEGDAAEALARLHPAGPPPECAALLAALLLPLLALRSEPRGPDR